MASGTINMGRENHLTGQILWTSTANGTVANTSTVKVTLQVARYYGSQYTTGGTFTGSLNVGGTNNSISKYLEVSTSWVTLYTYTKTVAHNDDGTGTCYIGATINGPNGTTMEGYSISANQTVTLDTIPRAATITSAPNFNDEENPTITYTNPAGGAVDSLQACISFDGSSANIAYRDIPTGETSYTFALTEDERNVLRNGTLSGSDSRTVLFYIKTVISGSTYYSKLQKTLTIINANPELSALVMDANEVTVALTGDRLTTLIKGYSNAAYEMSATGRKGASIESYSAKCGNSTAKTTTSGTFEKVESSNFTFAAKDNRGLTTTKTLTLNLINYFKPTCDAEATLELDGETTVRAAVKISGTFYNGSFGYENNSIDIQIKHSGTEDWVSLVNDLAFEPTISGNNYSIDFGVSGLDYSTPFTYQCRVIDKLDVATSKEDTQTFLPVFDWSNEDFNFNVPITMSGNTVLRHTDAKKVVLSAEGADIYLRPNGTSTDDGQLRLFTDGKATLNGSQIATVDMIYPVGAIYMSVNSTSPASFFGGTWERIQDRFLLAAGSTYSAGATGGAATHTLTKDEMPAHNHTSNVIGFNLSSSTSSSASEAMRGTNKSNPFGGSHTVSTVGGGKAHNNMPPYLTVYMWKRTA